MSYRYYNANSKGNIVNDCVLRAISVGEKRSWNDTYEKLSYLAKKEGTLLDDAEFVENYLDERYPRYCYKDMTVGEFAKKCPKGRFVVTMPAHITVIIDNVIYDVFDCSEQKMWCAWCIDK